MYTWDLHKVIQPAGISETTYRIRHLKAGRTGARKTWEAAPALLAYLLKDGLRNFNDKRIGDESVLDMAAETSGISTATLDKPCNVLELGGGSGFVSVGLAKALDAAAHTSIDAKIMCTDVDKNTIKNMRHNVHENNETKTVAVEKLEWGDDVGGGKFANALERKFGNKHLSHATEDPVQLLTHVIGSDLHFGVTTLDPLSSIISSIKLRNPNIQVIIMLKERSPNAVTELKQQIEMKIQQETEQDFTVHVRDVMKSGVPDFKMKLVEC